MGLSNSFDNGICTIHGVVGRIIQSIKSNLGRLQSSERIFFEVERQMERIIGSVPHINWESKDLPSAWYAFKDHSEFKFGSPLKDYSEGKRCNYLMIWIGIKKTRNLQNIRIIGYR